MAAAAAAAGRAKAERPDPEREAAVKKYTAFIRDTLEPRLRDTLERRDKVYELQAQYQQLAQTVASLRRQGTDNVQTRVNLGSDFFVQAVVPDASRLCVNIGLGFHAELTLEEADTFIGRKDEQLAAAADSLSERAAEIGADIQLAHKSLQELAALKGPSEAH